MNESIFNHPLLQVFNENMFLIFKYYIAFTLTNRSDVRVTKHMCVTKQMSRSRKLRSNMENVGNINISDVFKMHYLSL